MNAMTFAAVCDAEGRIGPVAGAESLGDAVLSLLPWLDEGWSDWIEVPGPTAQLTHHVAGGVAVERPSVGLPQAHAVGAGVDWFLPGVPAGTVVRVDGEGAGTTGGDGLTLRFDMPETYLVELSPPWPFWPAQCTLEVTA